MKTPYMISFVTGLLLMSVCTLSQTLPVSTTSPLDNLAFHADPSLSDNGWGGGSNKADLTDGMRTYGSEWARGLALGYGAWHQVTIDFGQPVTFDTVIQWYHGGMNNNEAAAYRLQYLRGTEWVDIFETDDSHAYLLYPEAATTDWWYYWSAPYKNTFEPVVSNQLRIWNYPLPGSHTWLWEVEVYLEADPLPPVPTPTPEPPIIIPTEIPTPGSAVPEPTTALLFGAGLLMMALAGFRRKFRP